VYEVPNQIAPIQGLHHQIVTCRQTREHSMAIVNWHNHVFSGMVWFFKNARHFRSSLFLPSGKESRNLAGSL